MKLSIAALIWAFVTSVSAQEVISLHGSGTTNPSKVSLGPSGPRTYTDLPSESIVLICSRLSYIMGCSFQCFWNIMDKSKFHGLD